MTADRTSRWLPLPALGFGGAQLGNLDRAVTDKQASATLGAAWASGFRYFDTAPHYGLGLSERRLGHFLHTKPREEYLVSTKVGRWLEPCDESDQPDREGFVVAATHRRVWDFTRDGVLRSIEASLERLGLDRIDVVLIHDPDQHLHEAIEQAAPALSQLRSEKAIGAYGAGTGHARTLARFVRETDMDVAMLAGRYTLLDQTAGEHLLPAALGRGVRVINAGIFNSGLLSRPRPRRDDPYDYGSAPAEVFERTTRIASVCERFGVDLPTAAVAFARRHPAVASVVVGLRTPAHVRELVERWSRQVPDDLWATLSDEGLLAPTTFA